MALKDILSQLSMMGSSEPLLHTSVNTKLTEMKIRDEELAARIQSQSGMASVTDLTNRHIVGNVYSVDLSANTNLYNEVPEYYRQNTFTLPETFSSTNLAYVYSYSGSEVVFGSSTTTYVYNTNSNTITETRPRAGSELLQGTLAYGYYGNNVICQLYDNSLVKFKVPNYYGGGVRPIVNTTDILLTIKKEDGTIVNITTILPLGKQIVTVVGGSDGHNFIVFTALSGSSNGGSNCDAWHRITWDGSNATVSDSGTLSPGNGITEYTSWGLTSQNFYGSACLEPNLEHLWCIDGAYGNIDVYRIYPDKVLRLEANSSIIPVVNSGLTATSSIASTNGFIIIKGNTLTLTRRLGTHYSTNPGIATFNQQSDSLSISNNLSDFGFGTGDFCINILFKTASSGKQMLFYTDTLKISVEDWSSGKGSIRVQSNANTFFSPSRLEPNKLQRLVIERSSGNLHISVNHKEFLGDTFSNNIPNPTVMYIGYDPTDSSYSFDGYIAYVHVTRAYRNLIGSIPSEPLRDSSDSLWGQTVLYVVPTVTLKIPRRELIKVELNTNGTINKKSLPNGWDVTIVYKGRYTIRHDLDNTNYIVIPSSSSSPIVSSVNPNQFDITTYNRNGALTVATFSCFVIEY